MDKSYIDQEASNASSMITEQSLSLWHRKLVRQNNARVKLLLAEHDIKIKNNCTSFCKDYAVGKAYCLPFPNTESTSTRIDQLIHMDLCGPMQANSLSGSIKSLLNGISTIRSDNGLEFANKQVAELLQHYGIEHQRTFNYTSEQNGSAEKNNRAARTILYAAHLPLSFWPSTL